MKISLARLTKWTLILVGMVVVFCFEVSWFSQNENTSNSPFYVAPAIWIVNFLRSLIFTLIWPRKIDLPFAVSFWFLVALLVFVF